MRRWISALGIVFGSALQAAPEAGDAPETGIVVEMPPYEVRANRILPRPENWLRVTVPALVLERGENALVAPGYYVLSNLSEQNTRLFINELQLRQFAGTLLWPMLVQTQPRQPAVVILDRGHSAGERRWAGISGSEWVGDPLGTAHRPNIMSTEGIATGLQWLEINSTPFIDRAGDPAGGVEAGDDSAPLPAGFVDAAMRGDCVVAWVSAGAPLAGFMRPSEERLAAAVNEEQMTLTLYAFSRRPPLWFIIGMRRLIAATEVSRTRITFARPAFAAPSRIGSDISRNAQAFIEGRGWGQSPETTSLRSSAVPQITLPQLLPLLGKAEGFTYEETMLASALVHYGLYGDNGKHRQKFMNLVERQSAGEELTDALFKEVFGFNTKKLRSKLSVYMRTFAVYKHHELRGKIPPMPEIDLRQATQAEAARLQAEAFIALGRFDLALDKLRIAYWRGEREPEMLAVLALLEQRAGSEARARKIVQTLMKLPQPPLRARVVAAKLRLQDALSARPEGAKLSMDETVEIMGLLGDALNQTGIPDEDVCETFAGVMSNSPTQPPPNVTDFLKKAAVRYSTNSDIAKAARLVEALP